MSNLLLQALGEIPISDLEQIAEVSNSLLEDRRPESGETAFIVVDYANSPSSDFQELVKDLQVRKVPFGILPYHSETPLTTLLERAEPRRLTISLERSAVRIATRPDFLGSRRPTIFREMVAGDSKTLSADLSADLLILQGHGSPIDMNFGGEGLLCGRALWRSGAPELFPCFANNRCFRQRHFNRDADDKTGRIDPREVSAQLLVIDACNSLPHPGSSWGYETTLLRGVVESRVGAAILMQGLKSNPLAAYVVLLTRLALGATLGEAIVAVNTLWRDWAGLAADNASLAPWVVIGHPSVTVDGLDVTRSELRRDGTSWLLPIPEVESHEGTLIVADNERDVRGLALAGNLSSEADWQPVLPWWAGAAGPDGLLSVWLGPDTPAGTLVFKERLGSDALREHAFRLLGTADWFESLASVVDMDTKSALAVTAQEWRGVAHMLSHSIAEVTGAPVAQDFELVRSETNLRAWLTQQSLGLDRFSVDQAAYALARCGPRPMRFLPSGQVSTGTTVWPERCACGAEASAVVRRDALYGTGRVLVSCPGCGPIADVAAALDGTPELTFGPIVGQARPGDEISVCVRIEDMCFAPGAVRGVLFEPSRSLEVHSEPLALSSAGENEVRIRVPEEWPCGLTHLNVVVSVAGALSFVDSDLFVLV